MKKIRVGVIFGGRSCEHEVSLQSAKGVMAAMDRDKFEVIPIGIDKQGQWVRMQDPLLTQDKDQPLLVADGDNIALLANPNPIDNQFLALDKLSQSVEAPQIDVVLPLLHGPMGEDGTIQGLFELAGIPYVGSGVLGSAVGMDKATMKALFQQAGLPQAPYQVILRKQWQKSAKEIQQQCEETLGYPCFIKPANMGSSVGISKAHDADEFVEGMNLAAQYDRKIIIEQNIDNTHEVELAVLGNDEPIVSVAGEIIPCNEFYDYNAKYIDDDSELIIPAPLPDAVTQQLQAAAIRAFQTLDCAGLARVDFLVRRDDHQIFILEANTMPGFTPISMYPKLWEASGIPYAELIERLIHLALDRHKEQQANQTSYLALS